MKVYDEMKNSVKLGSNLTEDTVAIVFKTEEEMGERAIGVIIPKLMVGYNFKNGDKADEKKIEIKKDKFLNADDCKFGSESVQVKNYIKVYPYLNQNIGMARYIKGDKVIVTFMDEDIKTIAFYPFSINRLGQRAVDQYMIAVPSNKECNTELTTDNAYHINVDSRKDAQCITISTTESNGEKCKFRITLDSKNGLLELTDEERTFKIDNPNDSVEMSTKGGASIRLIDDQIYIKGDTIKFEAETDFKINTDNYKLVTSSYTSEADTVKMVHENETKEITKGNYKIRDFKNSGTAVSYKYSTFHSDCPTIGLNGKVIFPNYIIGNIPNINVPAPPINGKSGPAGSCMLDTGIGGMPLVKFPPLSTILMSLATIIDAKKPPAPVAVPLITGMLSTMSTTKIMSM